VVGGILNPLYMRGRVRAHTKVLGTLLYGICSSILLPRSRPPIGVLVRQCNKVGSIKVPGEGCGGAAPKVQTSHRLRWLYPQPLKENEANGRTKVG
jgi:hypothetical protein